MAKTAHAIATLIKERIKNYDQHLENHNIGRIITYGDGIALVSGLDQVQESELLELGYDQAGEKILGITLNLDEEVIGVATLGNDASLKEGAEVRRTEKVISVPVGDKLFGRVIDAIGRPIDGKGPIEAESYEHIFASAPGVMQRQSVDSPIETGILVIDSMIPIGKGQRELIIGDRQTGKTAIAIDTIINQKGKNIKCIFVAIGQKNSTIAQIAQKLEDHGALAYTTIVVAGASELAPMQYLAPYTGATISEYVMKQGGDALVVYDDLSKHAVAYRTLSLLLKRPPGREAYPGDVFYLHSQLLERAARLNEANKNGSVTALPIVETQQGDISAYIPTNVISITDGQIFTSETLFNKGQRPAIDVDYSVSRVGSAAQIKAMKKNTASLKLELAQYNEMLAFAQFGSDLDKNTKRILNHGNKIYAMLTQAQYSPIDQSLQVFLFLVIKEKITNVVPQKEISNYKNALIRFCQENSAMQTLINEVKVTKNLKTTSHLEALNLLVDFTMQFVSRLANYNPKDHEAIPFLKKAEKVAPAKTETLKVKAPEIKDKKSLKKAKKSAKQKAKKSAKQKAKKAQK